MSATINIYKRVICLDGSDELNFGSMASPQTITVDGVKHEFKYSLANNTTKVILNVGTGSTDDIGDFDYFCIKSTQDLLIEFMGTTAADNSTLKIKANHIFELTTDDTLAYNASGAFAGSAQVITKISVRNTSGSTATITGVAIT